MKALVCKKFGPLDALAVEELPSPPLGARQARIAVVEAGVNFADTLIVKGQYQYKPPFPFSPGGEAAGIVVEVGSEVSRVKPGDRCMTTCIYGGFAEEVCVDEDRVFPIPDAVSFTTAAVFPVCYGTAHHALVDRALLRQGEWLLVLGAGSGVALTAVEMARLMGARVIAAAGSTGKLNAAREFGAEELIDYRRESLRERVKEITSGHGADIVFDPVGGELFEQALRCMAPGGRILVVGFASGNFPNIPANLLLLKEWAVVGVNTAVLFDTNPSHYWEGFDRMLEWAAEGKVNPRVSQRFSLVEAGRALAASESRAITGRFTVVVRP